LNDPYKPLKIKALQTCLTGNFVDFCKAHLCHEKNVLWRDPIWDSYGEVEIMVEYFMSIYLKNEELKKKDLALLMPEVHKAMEKAVNDEDAIYDWLDEMTSKEQENEVFEETFGE